MKKLIIFLAAILFAFPIIKPNKLLRYDYYISKITFNKKYLVVGLENGTILINDFKTNKNISKITLPKIHDFMGDLIAMPIYSLDISPDNKNILILAEGEDAIRNLYIYNIKLKKLQKIYATKKTLMTAKYINNQKIIFGLLSDEIEGFDLNSKKITYNTQVGHYVFSILKLNNDKTKVAIGDESGAIHIADTITGKKLYDLRGYNKDKTISLDFVKNYVINGSSDKRVAIYDIKTKSQITKTDAKFLPYAAAISPNVKKYAIQYDEKNNILVYDMYSKPLFMLKGHQMPLIFMKFINKNELFSASGSEIIIWNLKEKK